MLELPVGLRGVVSDAHDGPAKVDSFLAALGVPRAYLLSAVRAGVEERRGVTRFDPKIAPGMRDWLGRVRELRRQLDGDGWKMVDPSNSPFAESPDGSLLLGVMPGNIATGNPDMSLKSEYIRGIATAKLTRSNASPQLTFDRGLGITWPEADTAKVWFLVTHFEAGNEERPSRVRLEISQPGPTEQGHLVTSWSKRCCLEPLEFEGITDPAVGPDEGPIIVPVAIR
jgi:hypothetical protein